MSIKYVIACDLGTGGCKSSLYDENGQCLDGLFEEYETYYPTENRHEQKPEDWLSAVKVSIVKLLDSVEDGIRENISGIGLSGHSLGMVPLDKQGDLLMDSVPIWSDARPGAAELDTFFEKVPEEEWYMMTGNGFPPSLYTVFKILWLKNSNPELFTRVNDVIGTKDYINYKLTGRIATDYSYASGSGVYELQKWDYSDRLLEAAGLERSLFPKIVASTEVLGPLLPGMAEELGLPETVKVVAGGVDNSCMALGAKCFKSGRLYNSLGSSSWIAISSEKPVLDLEYRPFVFTHVVPGLYTSATSIFAAGSSHKWFSGIVYENPDYLEIDKLASSVTPGCNGLIFNPSIAGGSTIEKSPNIRGGFLGLSLFHTRAHMLRSVMEGVGYGLRCALDILRNLVNTNDEILVVGGGSKSSLWRHMLASIFGIRVVKTSIDQQAAALGAAALVLVGCELWDDFSKIDELHKVEDVCEPDKDEYIIYGKYLSFFKKASDFLSDFGDMIQKERLNHDEF